jgi:TP53 regulating kinase and related kinases
LQSNLEDSQTQFASEVGAEARIDFVTWHGRPAVKKARIPKSYRSEELDARLRSRRTKEEARILHEAKLAGVSCPWIYFADLIKSEIVMEHIQGSTLRQILNNADQKGRIDGNKEKLFFRLGQMTSALHSKNIIHGDLTTKNVIVSIDLSKISIVDFGLSFVSQRLEDRAEDLHLLKQALLSTLDTRLARRLFSAFVEGYEKTISKTEFQKITGQITEIERRGRYAVVD